MEGEIYKYDIMTTPGCMDGIEGIEALNKYGCGQFIVDEEKIIIRPFYSTAKYSVNQRERMADQFLDYIIGIGINDIQ